MMKPYIEPEVSTKHIFIPALTQTGVGSQCEGTNFSSFTPIVSPTILIDVQNGTCSAPENGFRPYSLENIFACATLQITAVADGTAVPVTQDFVLRVLNPDGSPAAGTGSGCIDDQTALPSDETVSFTALQSGTYQIHVHNKQTNSTASDMHMEVNGTNDVQPALTLLGAPLCNDSCPVSPI